MASHLEEDRERERSEKGFDCTRTEQETVRSSLRAESHQFGQAFPST